MAFGIKSSLLKHNGGSNVVLPHSFFVREHNLKLWIIVNDNHWAIFVLNGGLKIRNHERYLTYFGLRLMLLWVNKVLSRLRSEVTVSDAQSGLHVCIDLYHFIDTVDLVSTGRKSLVLTKASLATVIRLLRYAPGRLLNDNYFILFSHEYIESKYRYSQSKLH